MKKKLILTISIVLVFALTMFIAMQNDERVIYESGVHSIEVADAFAMMYETEFGSGEYVVSDDTTWPLEGYVFNAELSRCENGSTLYWDEETQSVMMEANVSDKCYIYFDVYDPPVLSNYIISEVYTGIDGENGLYYHDGTGTYINADQEAGDNSHRYAGANPNNYVCFGTDEEVCPTDNLYRIIGIFENEIKLIKNDYLTEDSLGVVSVYNNVQGESSWINTYRGQLNIINNFYWNSNGNNSWSDSTLNNALNNGYLNGIGNEWSNLIAEHTWTVGGNTYDNILYSNAKTVYEYEITNPVENTSYSNKIGLMYISDYLYSADSSYWNYPGYSTSGADYDYRSAIDYNWMYLGGYDWTITRRSTLDYSDVTNYAYRIHTAGYVGSDNVGTVVLSVRPTFYLNSDVRYISGTGTQSDPYRIA